MGRPLPSARRASLAGPCAALAAAWAQPLMAQITAPDADPPASAVSPICTDRPTKTNFACTVDAGHVQYEADVVNFSALRLDGVTTRTLIVVNPTLKYGLTPNLDVEANLSPFESVRTLSADGRDGAVTGISDLYLRLKYQFVTLWNGGLQASVLPYVKVPTARPGIGDGAVEEGAYLPVNYRLNGVFTLTTVPEFDALLDASGTGRHFNTAQLINLSASLPDNVTLYAELWGDWNFDPGGVRRQYSADTAVTWGVTPRLQLDLGVNAGLDRYTPAAQVYIGVSQKF